MNRQSSLQFFSPDARQKKKTHPAPRPRTTLILRAKIYVYRLPSTFQEELRKLDAKHKSRFVDQSAICVTQNLFSTFSLSQAFQIKSLDWIGRDRPNAMHRVT